MFFFPFLHRLLKEVRRRCCRSTRMARKVDLLTPAHPSFYFSWLFFFFNTMSQLLATFQSRKRTRITLCLSHKKMNRSPKTSHCLKLPAWSLMQAPNVGSRVLCVRIGRHRQPSHGPCQAGHNQQWGCGSSCPLDWGKQVGSHLLGFQVVSDWQAAFQKLNFQ